VEQVEVQPAQLVQLSPAPQAAHEAKEGVPVHVGPVLKRWGGGGAWTSDVEQQIRFAPEQSLSIVHDLGHVVWQMPLQQSSPVAVQSLDCAQVLGHCS
jgi:hypothetical protein